MNPFRALTPNGWAFLGFLVLVAAVAAAGLLHLIGAAR